MKTRLHVEDALAEGAVVVLGGARAHYLRHVLRLAPGAAVALFNGRDGEHGARIESHGRDRCTLRVGPRDREQEYGPDLWLLFAPVKRTRIDLIAEKATELGAAVIWPVLTRHTDVARVTLDRLRATAVEAAEQCERLDVPELREPRPLDRVLGGWDPARPLLVCAESGRALPVAAGLPRGRTAILTGPEGGFAAEELDLLAKLPFVQAIGLGPRVLRADTAVVAALSCWQALAGDWTRDGTDVRPPFRG